ARRPAARGAGVGGCGRLAATGALRDAARVPAPPGRARGATGRAAVREPHLLRLGVPAGPGRDQVRPRHEPPVAHAGRVRGSPRGDGGPRLLRGARAGLPGGGMRRRAPETLWAAAAGPDPRVLAYTVGDDRVWDARLLRWDVLGSLGHVEGLRAAGLLSEGEHRRLRAALRAALHAADRGRLAIGPGHEDVHTAVESWITRRAPGAGERLHTGRSRNDQVACDLRLYLKDRLVALEAETLDLAEALLRFAGRHRSVLWPGYTHQRRAMPSSVGLWALGFAEGLLDTVEALEPVWRAVDRSPLGSAAGYGVPLPLRR